MPRQIVPPPAAFTCSTAIWIVSVALIVRLGADTHRAFTSFAADFRRPERAAIGDGIGKRHQSEAAKMMMHAARRRLFQFFDGSIDRARREVPVIADFIIAACRSVESNLHAVFEHDRSTRRRHRNHALLPDAFRSTSKLPFVSRTWPLWSQRRTRVWRSGSCCPGGRWRKH